MLFRRERKVFHAVGIHVFIGRWHQSNAESCGNKTQDSLLLFSILAMTGMLPPSLKIFIVRSWL